MTNINDLQNIDLTETDKQRRHAQHIIPKLLTTAGIAHMLQLESPRVTVISQNTDFPEPVGKIGNTRVWLRLDIEAWAREWEYWKAKK